jgi:hypothetical protein
MVIGDSKPARIGVTVRMLEIIFFSMLVLST